MSELDRFLAEDLGPRGDVTTRALFGRRARPARGRMFARERLFLAGIPEAVEVFSARKVAARPRAMEGTWVKAGAPLIDVGGSLQAILAAERLSLNIVGRMSGIATLTRRLQDRATRANPSCRVAATRKTTPGFRAYEKRAVAIGGGDPHRYGLYDGVLIKDNHLQALGRVRAAVRAARRARTGFPVEVEVSRRDHAMAAAEEGVDWLLLDNLTAAEGRRIAAAVHKDFPHVRIESSGNITGSNLSAYATFSDRVSLGALTHGATSVDVSLDLAVRRFVRA